MVVKEKKKRKPAKLEFCVLKKKSFKKLYISIKPKLREFVTNNLALQEMLKKKNPSG